MVFALFADALALPEALLVRIRLGLLVHGGALEEPPGALEGGRLLDAAGLPFVDVPRDEVAPRLDLQEVCLQSGLLGLGFLQVLLLHLLFLLLLRQRLLQVDQSLLQGCLRVLQFLHAVLIRMLRCQFVGMCLFFLGLGLLQDELEHLDGTVATLRALALVNVLPSVRWCRVVLARRLVDLDQRRYLKHLGDLRIVLGQNLDGFCDQGLRLDKVRDVLLVRHVLLGAVLRLGDLAVVVLCERLFSGLDLRQEPCARVVNGRVQLRDGGRQLPDAVRGPLDGSVGVLALFIAPRFLLNIRLLLRLDEPQHLADLHHDGLEGIVGLQHQHDAGEQGGRSLVGLRRLQEGLRPLPSHTFLLKRLAVHANCAAAELDELQPTCAGRRDAAEGREGSIAVEDGGGLGQGSLLLRPQRHTLLVLLLLRPAHLQELGQEVLGHGLLRFRGLQLGTLRGQVVVVVPELLLLRLVGLLHLLVAGRHLLHVLVVCLLGPRLRLARRGEVRLEGVAHGLENAHDLAGPRAVAAREGRLQERIHGIHLLRADKRGGRHKGGAHRGLEPDEAALESGHVLLVVLGRAQGLVRSHLSERPDGVVHLVDRLYQVRLIRNELLVLILADRGGRLAVLCVLRHVRFELGDLLAELAGGGLQLLDLGLEDGNLLRQSVDLLGVLLFVGVAIALVLGEESPLGIPLGLGFLQQILQKLDDLCDFPVRGPLPAPPPHRRARHRRREAGEAREEHREAGHGWELR
mmetsp:Transcript_49347/g.125340  ORF Transcript_49347/g.125340 Transcript_49347/m.125340 type:complete len:744 (-) Transcript_49347:30-2261(-)